MPIFARGQSHGGAQESPMATRIAVNSFGQLPDDSQIELPAQSKKGRPRGRPFFSCHVWDAQKSMPPMPPPPGMAGAGLSFGTSATIASVVTSAVNNARACRRATLDREHLNTGWTRRHG